MLKTIGLERSLVMRGAKSSERAARTRACHGGLSVGQLSAVLDQREQGQRVGGGRARLVPALVGDPVEVPLGCGKLQTKRLCRRAQIRRRRIERAEDGGDVRVADGEGGRQRQDPVPQILLAAPAL